MAAIFHLSKDALLGQLEVDETQGLAEAEAARRLQRDGPNEIGEQRRRSVLSILWDQVAQMMVAILAVSALLSLFLGDVQDTLTIAAILLLNIALGFRLEYRAEQAIAALARMAAPTVRVRRSGSVRVIPARDLVCGDVVVLEQGMLVPADLRLLVAWELRTQEAALTGESGAVEKSATAVPGEDAPVADRTNCAFMGTVVAAGRAEGVVIATGSRTELGRIASLIANVTPAPTPLQRRLDHLGKQLAAAALGIVLIVLAVGWMRGEEPRLLLMTGISMAVAAVPEGLPAVVTITLALGAQRMLRRRALVRKLSAVETLGSVTVVCADKTGTLTANRMSVTVLDTAGHRQELKPDASTDDWDRLRHDSSLALLLLGGALCNDSSFAGEKGQDGDVIGDPTEAALLVAASRAGIYRRGLRHNVPRVAEYPFDSSRKRMTTVHRFRPSDTEWLPASCAACCIAHGAGYLAFTKGAPETVLALAGRAMVEGAVADMTPELRERVERASAGMAANGMRVLAVAVKPMSAFDDGATAEHVEENLVLIGLAGLMDPPRPEVRNAVETCRRAGIRPVMITGDHPLTARFVAKELGIDEAGTFLSGRDLDRMSDEELDDAVERVSVYARVSPEHKLRIVRSLQAHGHVVAMTGDGVNDAPALRQAGIGIAMGAGGTDVSRAASDMVLLDDNFTTIVAAVEEGRVIFDNIRKFVRYLIGSNSAEIWVMLLAPLLGMPLPLLPLQILWVNLVTDGPPALALSVEPAEPHTMRRAPRPADKPLLSRGMRVDVIWTGLVMAASSLLPGLLYWRDGRAEWQTIIFTTLVFTQMANALAVRSERESIFQRGRKWNLTLLAAIAGTVALQIGCVYAPLGNRVFRTVPLAAFDLAVTAICGSVILWAAEVKKWFRRRAGSGRENVGKDHAQLSRAA